MVNLLALVADTPLAAAPAQRDEFAGWLVGGTLRMIVYGAFEPPMWDISVVGRDVTRYVLSAPAPFPLTHADPTLPAL